MVLIVSTNINVKFKLNVRTLSFAKFRNGKIYIDQNLYIFKEELIFQNWKLPNFDFKTTNKLKINELRIATDSGK